MKKFLFLPLLFLALFALAQTEAPVPAVQEETAAPQPKDAVESGKINGTEVKIKTDDGLQISAVFKEAVVPAEEEKEPRYVILLPDLARNKSSFASFSRALEARSIGYLALDLRGHGKSATYMHYSKFAKEGINNEFNRMYKDVNAAVNFLKEKKIKASNIFVIGAGLGANVAASSIVFNNDIGGFGLITPTTNVRDVLTIPGVKVSKQPILIAAAPDVRKNFLEASLIRNTAFIAQGAGKITFLTAYNKTGAEMIDSYLSGHVAQWIETPSLPEIKDDSYPKLTAGVLEGLPEGESLHSAQHPQEIQLP